MRLYECCVAESTLLTLSTRLALLQQTTTISAIPTRMILTRSKICSSFLHSGIFGRRFCSGGLSCSNHPHVIVPGTMSFSPFIIHLCSVCLQTGQIGDRLYHPHIPLKYLLLFGAVQNGTTDIVVKWVTIQIQVVVILLSSDLQGWASHNALNFDLTIIISKVCTACAWSAQRFQVDSRMRKIKLSTENIPKLQIAYCLCRARRGYKRPPSLVSHTRELSFPSHHPLFSYTMSKF